MDFAYQQMNVNERQAAELELTQFMQTAGPDMRNLHSKIRDLKRESVQWNDSLKEYERKMALSQSNASDNNSKSGNPIEDAAVNAFTAQQQAMENMVQMMQEMKHCADETVKTNQQRGIILPAIQFQKFKVGETGPNFGTSIKLESMKTTI